MILLYFKQAWNLLKQEKLFSSIYIIGTGLSITMIMVLSIVFYIKIADIYPETNRNRLLIVKSGRETVNEGWINTSSLSEQTIDQCFRSLKNAEAITAIYKAWQEEFYIQLPQSKEQLPVAVGYVDTQFWTVFPFSFIDGKPFTDADFQSAIYTTVIAESLAEKIFGTTDVTGQYVEVDYRPYRISGVVKDASFATERTYAQLWVPYTLHTDYKKTWGISGALGDLEAYLLSPTKEALPLLRQEALDNLNRYNQTLENVEFSVVGQPDRQWQSTFRYWSGQEVDFTKVLIQYGLLFLVLLGVPAISFSGMTDSRMERRLTEMGVRRSFGASSWVLMKQIISENFLFTLLGGAVGLLFSYLIIWIARDSILHMGQNYVELAPEGTNVVFTPSMLMNFSVFSIALIVCFLLNLVSALLPAWRASSREIIYSLNAKQ